MTLLLIASGLINLICLYHVMSSDIRSDFSGLRQQMMTLSNKFDALMAEHQFMQTKVETCFTLSEKAIGMPKRFSVTLRRPKYKKKIDQETVQQIQTGVWS